MPQPNKSQAEEAFLAVWAEDGLPGADLVPQYVFHPVRRWRFDFAVPSLKVAVEIQGMGRVMPSYCNRCKSVARCPKCGKPPMVSQAGGHQTPKGMRNDCEKNNEALMLGWRIITFSTAAYDPDRWVEVLNKTLLHNFSHQPTAHTEKPFLNAAKKRSLPAKKKSS